MTALDQPRADPLAFWTAQSRRLHWIVKPSISLADPPAGDQPRLDGGVLNVCFNAVDRHAALGRAEEAGVSRQDVVLTFADLTEQSAQFAGVLRTLGLVAGDRVLTCLPRSVDFAVVLLACARIGVHCVVTSGAADSAIDATALTEVIAINQPLVIVHGAGAYAASVARALELSVHQPERCVVVAARVADQSRRRGDGPDLAEWQLDFHGLMRSSAIQPTECVPMPAASPLYTAVSLAARTAELVRRTVDTGEHALRLIAAADEADEVDPVLWPSRTILAPLLAGRASQL
jgi:propionyl-CoA synthetase